MKNNMLRRFLAALVICAMLVTGLSVFLANAEEAAPAGEPAEEQILDNSAEEEPAEEEVPAADEVLAEEEPVVEEPVVEEPMVEEPVAEEPVVEEPVVEEPAAEEPAAEEPVVEEPVAEEPVVEEPVAEEPAAEEPVAEEPVAEEPVVEEPVVEEPVVEEPVVEEPVVEEPVVEEPVVEEPVVEEAKAEKASAKAPAAVEEFEDYETPLGTEEYQTIVLEEKEDEEFTDVDVREGADGMSNIFTSLPAGSEITVVGIDGDWAHVVVNGQEGYIYADDLAGYIEEPEQETAEEITEDMKVTIFTSRRTAMTAGETVYLTSKVEGLDGYKITYQWECDKHDGRGFQDISGATEATYSYKADPDTLSWDWRLTVYLD